MVKLVGEASTESFTIPNISEETCSSLYGLLGPLPKWNLFMFYSCITWISVFTIVRVSWYAVAASAYYDYFIPY
jgi:hypothetical protein